MVVMLEIVVVAAGIIIASPADPRESLIGATMVNFLLFTIYGPLTLAYSLIHLKLLICSSFLTITPNIFNCTIWTNKYSDFASLVPAVLFHFVYT